MTFQGTKIRVIVFTLIAAMCAYGRPSQIVVVSPAIGNPVRSGDDLLSALGGITAPSATNPWLLKIEPGAYDLGTRALVMKPFVDVEGSGREVTVVRSAGQFTVVTASNAELRGLTVRSTNPTPQSTGLGCDSNCLTVLVAPGVNAKLADVAIDATGLAWGLSVKAGASAEVSGGSVILPNFGYGVVNDGVAALKGTTIHVSDLLSYGVLNGGTLRLSNATVEAEPGTNAIVSAVAGITNVHHSLLRGRLLEILGGTARIGASQVIDPGGTGAKCVASYDGSFNPLGANCQPAP